MSADNHGKIIHAGARLKRQLPPSLDDDLRGEIGIAAAEAPVAAMPERSSTVVDLARALRYARHPAEACDLLRKRLPTLKGTVDLRQIIRGYFYEWSTCAGNLKTRQGSIIDAWLASFSPLRKLLLGPRAPVVQSGVCSLSWRK